MCVLFGIVVFVLGFAVEHRHPFSESRSRRQTAQGPTLIPQKPAFVREHIGAR